MPFGVCRQHWQRWKGTANASLAACRYRQHSGPHGLWAAANRLGGQAGSPPPASRRLGWQGLWPHISSTPNPGPGSPQPLESLPLNHVPVFKIILWETSGWAQMGSGKLQKEEDGVGTERRTARLCGRVPAGASPAGRPGCTLMPTPRGLRQPPHANPLHPHNTPDYHQAHGLRFSRQPAGSSMHTANILKTQQVKKSD